MRWHIVCQVGSADDYRPSTHGQDLILNVGLEHPTHPGHVHTNVPAKLAEHGLIPPPAALDCLNLAMAVFAADLRVQRQTAYDRWTRDFVLHLPVRDPGLWMPVTATIVRLLSFLTGDHWDLQLRPRTRSDSPGQHQLGPLPTPLPTAVCLFSGGLDSYAGAVDVLERGEFVALVGQYHDGITSQAQKETCLALERFYAGRMLPLRFRVQPPTRLTGQKENTMRGRSILFLGLGMAVATALGPGVPLVVPENGFISLNVPLTNARTGSLSTRTTHPHLMALFREVFAALGLDCPLELPYRFFTKGELLDSTRNPEALRAGIPKTLSCAHPSVARFHGGRPDQHCGYCVPCLIRRAALSAVGQDDEDYFIDVLTNPPTPASARGRDLRAMAIAIEHQRGAKAYRLPFEVRRAGPLPGTPAEIQAYVEVYRRGMDEICALLQKGEQ
jgi:hypothetical protein